MLDLMTPATFDFFARYFLAGFIIATVRSRFVIGEKPSHGDIVYESIILSLINQLIFQALTALTSWIKPLVAGWLWQVFANFVGHFITQVETLVLPAFLGLLLGGFLQRGWNKSILGRLGMPIIHPTRRAYDYAFGDITTERFVIVTFTDGTVVNGFFGANSLASSDPANGDIYIERLYDGAWKPTIPPKSALLMLSDLRSIEFIDPAMETNDGPQVAE